MTTEDRFKFLNGIKDQIDGMLGRTDIIDRLEAEGMCLHFNFANKEEMEKKMKAQMKISKSLEIDMINLIEAHINKTNLVDVYMSLHKVYDQYQMKTMKTLVDQDSDPGLKRSVEEYIQNEINNQEEDE